MADLFFHIGLNARRSNLHRWGDYDYATFLVTALSRQGCRASIFCRDEQPRLQGPGDVILWICGPHVSEPIAGLPNFLWMISPPNMASLGVLRRMQAVYVASQTLADVYSRQAVQAHYVPQATDPGFFHPGRDPGGKRYDFVFVGNLTMRARRPEIRRALDMGFDVTVWGRGWDKVAAPQQYGGPRLDADQLAGVYARANVVLNSHMPQMSRWGMMSNRSFDALASGARVISDEVAGFKAPDLPDLIQVADRGALGEVLQQQAQAEPLSRAGRDAIAERVKQRYSFDQRAALFIDQAEQALAANARLAPVIGDVAGHVADPSGGRAKPQTGTAVVRSIVIRDDAPETAQELAQALDQQLADGPLSLRVELTDPATIGYGAAPNPMLHSARAVLRLGEIYARRAGFDAITIRRTHVQNQIQPLHPGMFDLRRVQRIITLCTGYNDDHNDDPTDDHTGDLTGEMQALCLRARRVIEAFDDASHPLRYDVTAANNSQVLVRILNNRPLYPHAPQNYDRDSHKTYVALWPRKRPVRFDRPVGVFLHLYYPVFAGVFHKALNRLPVDYQLYISTDTQAKAKEIAAVFPRADIRVLPNRGRDVFPKLYGFGDVFSRHDLSLHLHGKKSKHTAKLEGWLDLILQCLLPQPTELNRLLSFFCDIPDLGLVVPPPHQSVIGACHWGDNLELAQEVMARTGHELDPTASQWPGLFPVGGMFWARNSAISPLLKLDLRAQHFPAETGQLDATVAHAIERLLGVVCRQQGYQGLRVAPEHYRGFRAFRHDFRSNGALRNALRAGELAQADPQG